MKLCKRLFQSGFILFFTLAFILIIATSVNAAIHNVVYSSGETNQIQNTIDLAAPGDTIIVHDGTYQENIVINKQLTIKSENGFGVTNIEAGETNNHVVTISAPYVNLKGFSIYGATGTGKAGIYMDSFASNCTIKENRIGIYNYFGINLSSSNNNRIYLNTFSNNTSHISSTNSSNKWQSSRKYTYSYSDSTHKSYMGNYYDDYTTRQDTDGNGIADSQYTTDGDNDQYPLMEATNSYTNIRIDISQLLAAMMAYSQMPNIISFTATPSIITSGETCVLRWEVANADTVNIQPDVGDDVGLSGETVVLPTTDTTYTLTAIKDGGIPKTRTVGVEVTHPPSITVLEPNGDGDVTDSTFTITWTDEDIDDGALIFLFYDTDNFGEDGTIIASDILEDPDGPGNDEYVWDVSGVPPGTYYIYALIDEGVPGGDSMTAYSSGPVTISPPPSRIEYEYDAMGRLIKIIKVPQ